MKEWQYAAKGGKEFRYSGSDKLDEVGWYTDNSGSKTHPVAQKAPNGYELYDMSGNVWELCWDSYSNDCNLRYNCGGSWGDNASHCEVGYKIWINANDPNNDLGFRIFRSTGK
ncbi:formylglycine-generating enzyme family protein [Treponema succinifaciens]|uniref:formylglycine-generating enzyme family protein n=1 Tax=Treponema succinifaciens TaxID=167 RepID=UPI003F7DC8BB